MKLHSQGRIRGECNGFESGRVFEMDNGLKWQQAESIYRYRYKFRPVAKIWENGGSYYIEIEGMDEKVRVRRA